MRHVSAILVGIAVLGGASAFAADQTWTGTISDSICAASHQAMAQQIDPTPSDHDCTLACIDSHAKYVLVDAKQNVLPIGNQDFPALKEHAGEKVTITGEMKEGAIQVSKVEPVK